MENLVFHHHKQFAVKIGDFSSKCMILLSDKNLTMLITKIRVYTGVI